MPPPPPPPPTELAVSAVDGSTGAPLAGVEILLLENGQTLITGASGGITVELEPGVYTYQARAAGFVSLPRPGRALGHVSVLSEKTVALPLTFEPRPSAIAGGTLTGVVTVDGAAAKGVLVVATATGYFSALTDATGTYRMLGVASGFYNISAFTAGYTGMARTNIEVKQGMEKTGVDFALASTPGAVVSGMLSGGTGTSSISLVHATSGDIIPGLSTAASLAGGTYSIGGVPPGTFRIIAARELDGVTLDYQSVLDNGDPEVVVTDTSSKAEDLRFKAAISGLSPTHTATVSTKPTIRWNAVPMANFYNVEIRNVTGQVIIGGFDTRGGAREIVLAPATSFTLRDTELVRGALYTWRVYAAKDVTTGDLFELLASSEELEGEFRVER
jgi:hypothetical protein